MPELTRDEETDRRLVRLDAADNVVAVAVTMEKGATVAFEGAMITFAQRVPTGHKVAVAPIAAGEKVLKYGAPIGSATCDIRPGEYVHTHNLASDYLPTYTLENPPDSE